MILMQASHTRRFKYCIAHIYKKYNCFAVCWPTKSPVYCPDILWYQVPELMWWQWLGQLAEFGYSRYLMVPFCGLLQYDSQLICLQHVAVTTEGWSISTLCFLYAAVLCHCLSCVWSGEDQATKTSFGKYVKHNFVVHLNLEKNLNPPC